MINQKCIYTVFSIGFLALFAFASCTSPTGTTHSQLPPAPASGVSSKDGILFSVAVSNTRLYLGESIDITTELRNASNTNGVTIQGTGGETTLQITNSDGQIVWGTSVGRSGTTPTATITIRPVEGRTANLTWTATTDPHFTVPVTAGIYTLNVSDSGFYDPTLNAQVPFSVTLRQITVLS